jgi:hypothetical protein
MRQDATFGAPAGLLPPPREVYCGLRRFLSDPSRQRELTKLRARLPREAQPPYDSHPPMAGRVRTIEALPADAPGSAPGSSRPALEPLHDLDQILVELENVTLTGESLAFSRVDWTELADPAVRQAIDEDAGPPRAALRAAGAAPTLDGLLDAADAGRLSAIAEHLPAPALRAGASGLAGLALTESGAGHWELTWDQGLRLVLPDGTGEDALAAGVDAVGADTPDTAPLRRLLAIA